ncbi:hypothetical protein BaRGS_00021778 [Batillaria attramentaria]|uniref:Uncharacterized protein n=1 Tax=Batillaria attramentaria TaxID=370345 RepID=A0ABD0KIR9_9CAEN
MAFIEAAQVASMVIAGTSVLNTVHTFSSGDYSHACRIQVENWTRFPLTEAKTRIKSGNLCTPLLAVLPAKKEAMVAHGSSGDGTMGTVSLKVEGLDRRVYIMWTNTDKGSKWLAVGLSEKGKLDHPEGSRIYDHMFTGALNDQKSSGYWILFDRKEYGINVDPIVFRDDKVILEATMGTSRKTDVELIVVPVDKKDLAGPIRKELEKKSCCE